MKRQGIAIAAVVGVAGLCLGAILVHETLLSSAPEQLLAWDDPATVARGHVLYNSECAVCHGRLASGGTGEDMMAAAPEAPPHDATGHTWEHPDFALFQLTKSGEVAELCRTVGESEMPEFSEALTDRQILDVLSYIKSTWPEDIRARQDATNAMYASQNAAVRSLVETSDF